MGKKIDTKKLKKEWVDLSAPWIKEAREGRNSHREGLLDEYMLQACGDVKGLKILDSGCGEGRFCRMLAKKGADYVLGIDLSTPMIKAAREIKIDGVEYKVADVQKLDFLKNNSFDIVVSYLNQCDLPNFEKNNSEMFRILKKGGLFVVANLHPMRSARGGWKKDSKGNKEYAAIDNYFDESERHWNMLDVDFTNFHRTLSTYINSFLNVGFLVQKVIEPTVSKKNLEKYPELKDELRVPNFIIYLLKK